MFRPQLSQMVRAIVELVWRNGHDGLLLPPQGPLTRAHSEIAEFTGSSEKHRT
ncbi:hypothetical protein DPMN_091421 [Dreissena polymorpha]|uniref:Uncharacterized protein n=1 Tax=Dreissena polymorpha TaxID=45954 RepID=A0A9D4KZU8_DREPO|nr:hypothetical protein DPMN_091421 [Dreissena polymorpha]